MHGLAAPTECCCRLLQRSRCGREWQKSSLALPLQRQWHCWRTPQRSQQGALTAPAPAPESVLPAAALPAAGTLLLLLLLLSLPLRLLLLEELLELLLPSWLQKSM